MLKDVWLPKGYKLADNASIQALLFAGNDWQIFATSGMDTILLARCELARRWCDAGFLEPSLLGELVFGAESFCTLASLKKFFLLPVEKSKSPDSKVDAIAFALALQESRKIAAITSLHDAIYVEQYSRLLPTWSVTPQIDDALLLGTWLSGGVAVSTNSFRRLHHLTGWMPAEDLMEVINAAGLHVAAGSAFLAKRKPAHNEKQAAVPASNPQLDTLYPDVALNDKVFTLPGRPQLEAFFNEHVIDIILNAEKYQALGIEFPSAIVLHGPPGCGKTFAVEKLVEFIDWPSFQISSSSIGSPYIHATSKKISEVFDKAIEAAPAVVVIDEMEAFLSARQTNGATGLHHIEEVAEFLRRIPEAIQSKVLIIAMTNLIELIDPAILRRGRFDHVIEVGMPSKAEVASLLEALLDKLPKEAGLSLDASLDALTGRPLSDAAFVIREAARLAAKDSKKRIDQLSLHAALDSLPAAKGENDRRIGFA